MAKVSKLEMAPQVLNHSNITIQKSLLGEKVIYTPTGSRVKAYQREYASSDGKRHVAWSRAPLAAPGLTCASRPTGSLPPFRCSSS